MVAGDRLELSTFGLWAQWAANCSTPRAENFLKLIMENPQDRQIYMDRLVVKIQTKFMNFYDNINLEWKERIINMKIDIFNVVELKDENRATIIDVREKNEKI